MQTPTTHPLFDALRASGLWTDQQVAAADAIDGPADDLPALADRLWQQGLLTRYQYAKVRGGRVDDILLGPYLVLDKVGEGGMGKVFKAVEVAKKRLVALKTIRPQLMTNKVVLKRYEREAKAVQSLSHPNVVGMYDAAEVCGRFVLAMEFVEGIDLSRIMKEFGRPPEFGLADYQEACEYVRQTALGLQAAHDLGFVHRDIKPSNMLVTGERPIAGTGGKATVKLLDLGLVRQVLDNEDATKTELTRDGTVVGTPDYMAPEQAKNSSTVDHRADLYSLGCTLYFLLRGQVPFPDGSPLDKLIRHQLDAPPDLRPLRPDVPEAVHQIMERLLKKKPSERYDRAADVAAALAPYTPGGSAAGAAAPAQPVYAPFSLEPDPPHPPTPLGSTPASVTAAPGGSTVKLPAKGPVLRPVVVRGGTAQMTPASGTTTAPPPRLTPVTAPPAGRPILRVMPAGPTGGPMTPVADGEAVGPLSGQLTAKLSRASTPVSTPKPAAPRKPAAAPHRAAPKKRRGGNATAYWAVGGVIVVGGFGLGLLAVRPSGGGGGHVAPTAPTAPTAPGAGDAARLPPAAQMFPPGTVAAVTVHPQPLWKAAFEHPAPPAVTGRLESLVKRVRLDTKLFDRLCVAFSARPGHYVAVGEGPFLTPEWTAETESRLAPNPADASTAGGAKVFKLAPKTDPGLAAAVPGHGYAVSNDPGLLNSLVKGLTKSDGPKVAADLSRDLVRVFSPSAGGDTPVATFAATGAWSLPLPGARALDQDGVRFAVAEARWADKFDLSLTLTGTDEGELKDFVNLVLAKQLTDRFPSLKPLAARLAALKPEVARSGTDVTYRLHASFTWDEVAAAVGGLFPARPTAG